jgi:hypothetical protein
MPERSKRHGRGAGVIQIIVGIDRSFTVEKSLLSSITMGLKLAASKPSISGRM